MRTKWRPRMENDEQKTSTIKVSSNLIRNTNRTVPRHARPASWQKNMATPMEKTNSGQVPEPTMIWHPPPHKEESGEIQGIKTNRGANNNQH